MVELTKTDKKKLQSCFKGLAPVTIALSYDRQGKPEKTIDLFLINDDKIENKLYKHYGLTTDDNWHKTLAFTFWYDWSIQNWRVGA